MASMVEKIAVADDRFQELWGVSVLDYKIDGKMADLQDLLVKISQERATSIEQEVLPLQDIITRRNERLEKYGVVLQKLTEVQAMFTSDDKDGASHQTSLGDVCGSDKTLTLDEFWSIMSELGGGGSGSTLVGTKARIEGWVTRCKSNIDVMNNDAQSDMTRLQAVVDRRDESYSTATSLMSSVSDTRSSLIKNL